MVEINAVKKNSIAERIGILPKDILLSVNGHEINDLLDYKLYIYERKTELCLKKGKSKEKYKVNIKKSQYEEIGLEFSSYIMDEKKSCRNKCIFCFVDQLPQIPKLRDTLYFKDDDERLSFLYGNYITLTNLNPEHIQRIIKMRISPINISVHTTNKELRIKMMNNKNAGEVLDYIKVLCDNNISVNAQIVLCKNVNDGKELEQTLIDLSDFFPQMQSIAVVPSGLTKYRDGLYPLEPLTKEDCAYVIRQVDRCAEENIKNFGYRGIFCSDEFYIKAEAELPDIDYYEDYPQLENGVGMVRLLLNDFYLIVDENKIPTKLEFPRICSIATGVAACSFLKEITAKIESICENFKCNVYAIKNEFFGENITVTGLIVGNDLIRQLKPQQKNKELGEILFINRSMLRYEQDLFLDDVSTLDVEKELAVKLQIVGDSAEDLIKSLLGIDI